ncbi:uncharacterized protein SPAPADRAFT_59056, partial [Spathaspora passalidarum NRRL Y-27907]
MLSLNYEDLGLDIDANDNSRGVGSLGSPSGVLGDAMLEKNDDENNMDLDMNNLLGNDESFLDGLNMNFIESGADNAGSSGQIPNDGEFDVDNFLSQFGGS